MKPKFKIGDLVRHIASGERGIVVLQNQLCTFPHQPLDFGHKKDCEFEFAGTYHLSTGLDETVEGIQEYLLERDKVD